MRAKSGLSLEGTVVNGGKKGGISLEAASNKASVTWLGGKVCSILTFSFNQALQKLSWDSESAMRLFQYKIKVSLQLTKTWLDWSSRFQKSNKAHFSETSFTPTSPPHPP